MRLSRLVLLIALVLPAAACRTRPDLDPEPAPAAPVAAAPPPSPAEPAPPMLVETGAGRGPDFLAFPAARDDVVATVGPEELRKSQVFDYMLTAFPDKVKAAMLLMLSNRVLAAECAKHGIEVPERDITAWYQAHRAAMARTAEVEYGAGTTFEQWLQRRFGQTPHEYELAARDRERSKQLLGRLIRYHQILEDRVQLRLISVTDEDRAAEISRKIAAGADFAALARRHSIHPTAENGGLMFPVWRLALNPALDLAAFTLPIGEVSEVIAARDDTGRARYQIIKVVERHQGRSVPYAEVEQQIVDGLRSRPLSEDEWYMWQVKTERMTDIRLRGTR